MLFLVMFSFPHNRYRKKIRQLLAGILSGNPSYLLSQLAPFGLTISGNLPLILSLVTPYHLK